METHSTESKKFNINLPNALTIIRLFLSPLIVVVIVLDSTASSACYLALIIAILAEITDLLDGYIARKYNKITDLGKILDPMADSIYRCSAFISLAVIHQYSPYLILPILYRDSVVLTLRHFCAERGIVVAARWSGKLKALFQGPTIISIIFLRLLVFHNIITLNTSIFVSNILMGITALITLYSAFDYFRGLYPHLREDA